MPFWLLAFAWLSFGLCWSFFVVFWIGLDSDSLPGSWASGNDMKRLVERPVPKDSPGRCDGPNGGSSQLGLFGRLFGKRHESSHFHVRKGEPSHSRTIESIRTQSLSPRPIPSAPELSSTRAVVRTRTRAATSRPEQSRLKERRVLADCTPLDWTENKMSEDRSAAAGRADHLSGATQRTETNL